MKRYCSSKYFINDFLNKANLSIMVKKTNSPKMSSFDTSKNYFNSDIVMLKYQVISKQNVISTHTLSTSLESLSLIFSLLTRCQTPRIIINSLHSQSLQELPEPILNLIFTVFCFNVLKTRHILLHYRVVF